MVSYAKHSFQRIKSFAYGAKNRIRIENSMKTTFKRNAQQSWVRISLTRGAKCCNNLYRVDKEEICCRPFLIFKGVIYGLSTLYARYLMVAVSILMVSILTVSILTVSVLTVSFVTVSVMTAAMVWLSLLADWVAALDISDLEGNSALVLILVA